MNFYIDENAAEIFQELIAAMSGKEHLKIFNPPFMPLTIEQIGPPMRTWLGIGTPFSLCHYYEQNGDLMQDPEMEFIVIAAPDLSNSGSPAPVIVPYAFTQANLGIYQRNRWVTEKSQNGPDMELLAEHISFANMWLQNIRQQGFLVQARAASEKAGNDTGNHEK